MGQDSRATDETFTYSVTFGGDVVWVAINRADGANSAGGLPSKDLVDELTVEMVTGPSVMVPATSARVLARP